MQFVSWHLKNVALLQKLSILKALPMQQGLIAGSPESNDTEPANSSCDFAILWHFECRWGGAQFKAGFCDWRDTQGGSVCVCVCFCDTPLLWHAAAPLALESWIKQFQVQQSEVFAMDPMIWLVILGKAWHSFYEVGIEIGDSSTVKTKCTTQNSKKITIFQNILGAQLSSGPTVCF